MAAPWTRASNRLGRTPSATRRRKSWASDLSKWMRSVRRRWSFHHRAAEQEDAQQFLALTPYGSQAASIKVRSAAAISLQRNFRMVAAQRERQRLKAAHDEYWEYAYRLLREDSAERLQHCWRAHLAKRSAAADLALLREWDTLLRDLKLARHAEAQRLARHREAAMVVQRSWRRLIARRTYASRVSRRFLFFSQAQAQLDRGEALNPFSGTYVGPLEHRRRVEAELEEKLRAYGAPKRSATERALPAQLATLLNVLRFVDAINAILDRGYVASSMEKDVEGMKSSTSALRLPVATKLPAPRTTSAAAQVAAPAQAAASVVSTLAADPLESTCTSPHSSSLKPDAMLRSAQYEELMDWGDAALQARFGGAAQYIKSARRFGLLHFEGDIGELVVRGGRVISRSIGSTREDLLHFCLRRPLLVVPGLAGVANPIERLKKKLDGPPCRALIDEYLSGSFDTDQIYSVVDTVTDSETDCLDEVVAGNNHVPGVHTPPLDLASTESLSA